METIPRRLGKLVNALLLMLLLGFAASPLHAQPRGVYWFAWPYDGSAGPRDLSRIAFGNTREEACAKRTEAELTLGYGDVIYVGILPGTLSCGFQWLNFGIHVIDNPDVTPAYSTCQQLAVTHSLNPEFPFPDICPLQACSPDQLNPDGYCLITTGKNAGQICITCGNPVSPANGNKFQEETDLAPAGASGLRFSRYYNNGRPAYDKVLGGFWTHSYARRILINGAANEAAYYREDGKQYVFRLQSGAWAGDADVSDSLVEVKNASGRRTGWRYTTAATEEVALYDASGRLVSIETRSGLRQSLTYTDGTNGTTTGKGGYVLDAAGNPTTFVLPKGLLLRVTDKFGRALGFGYDSLSRIVKVVDPGGAATRYGYDVPHLTSAYNLLSVTYPDGRQRLYSYNEPGLTGGADLPNALTGITDENGARFATYAYDQYGRTIETVHDAGGSNANRYRLQYDISGAQTTVIDPAGTTRTYGFDTVLGVVQNTGVTQSSASGSGLAANSTVYDPGGNVASRTDFNGNRTNYEYDLTRNLETRRVEGLTAAGGGTPQTRTISTAWHPAWRLPTRIAEPLKITSFAYNGDGGTACGLMADGTTPVPGVLCAKTIQATTDADGSRGFAATAAGSPRTWRYVYNANGLVLAADGPRDDVADVTSTTYFADDDPDFGKRGNVATITNAAGHVTSITAYNAHGQPTTIVDPNGLVTTLTYDARQRLAMRTVGTETTSYAYDGVGQLIRVTLPDGSFLAYAYDAAHRLTGMADSLGNSVSYTLDAMGNRVREDVFDPSSVLAQTRRRVYDNLNRLFREVGAVGQTTEYSYDNEGNVISVKDPLNRVTGNRYDALNRLAQVTDPNQGVTRYGYNGLDALTSVTDPRGLVTGYVVDGLGNLNEQSSPDTGTTTNTYDAVGNLVRQTDAKGQTAVYAYDALNRVTSITFADGSKHVFVYDQGTNGLGRLTGITETDPASQVTSQIGYGYDAHGRVVSESRTLAGQTHSVAYGYDAAGRLAGMTYPSGRGVTYAYDGAGRIAEVATTYTRRARSSRSRSNTILSAA